MVANSGMTNNRLRSTTWAGGQDVKGRIDSPSALQEVALGGEVVANDPVQAQVRKTKMDINGKLMTILWANQLPVVGSWFADIPSGEAVCLLKQAREQYAIESARVHGIPGGAANNDNYALAA